MDIEKDSNREAFEAIPRNARVLRGAKFKDSEYVALSLFDESSKELAGQLNYGWEVWQAAKAQAELEIEQSMQSKIDKLQKENSALVHVIKSRDIQLENEKHEYDELMNKLVDSGMENKELQKRVDAALKMISINRGFAWGSVSISRLEQALKGEQP